MKRARFWAALAAIVVVGAGMRLWDIGAEALWTDEALTLSLVQLSSFDLMFRPVDPTPGLYYLLQKWFASGAITAGEARYVSAAAGITAILLAAWLGRVATDRRGALLMAALVAGSAPLIVFSQEARAYSLCVALITASAAALVAYGRADGNRRALFALFALAGLGAAYTHFIGWLWTGPAAIVAWLHVRGDPIRRQEVGVALLGIAVLSLPEIYRTLGYSTSGRDAFHWLVQPGVGGLSRSWARIVLPPGPWPMVAASAVLVLLFIVRAVAEWRKEAGLALAVGLLLALEPLIAWLFGFAVRPIAVDRSLLPGIIGVSLLLVMADRGLRQWPVVPLLTLGFLAATLAWGGERTKGDWRGAADIAARFPERPVVLCPFYSLPALQAAASERGIRAGPLIVVTHDFMLAIESRLGANRHFGRDYASGLMARIVPAYEVDPGPAPVRGSMPPAAHFLFIDVGCDAVDRRLAVRWFGPARTTPIWHGIAGREGTTMTIYAIDAAAIERPLMFLPARPM